MSFYKSLLSLVFVFSVQSSFANESLEDHPDNNFDSDISLVDEKTEQAFEEAKEIEQTQTSERSQRTLPLETQTLDVETAEKARRMPSRSPSGKYDNYGNAPVKIYHPNAKKGLTRITSDRTYIYKTQDSPRTGASSLRLGILNPTKLKASNGQNFSELYDNTTSMPVLFFEYEWNWFKSYIGRLGFQAGTGLFSVNGNGRFSSTTNAALTPKEGFTLFGFPFLANLIYRLQFWDKQWFVPYASGGAGYIGLLEIRDDNKSPKIGGAAVAQGSGGLAFSLTAISPTSATELDREYGINQAWLAIEYRIMQGLSNKFDFSSQIVNAGLMVEF